MIDIHTHLWNVSELPESIQSYFGAEEADPCTAEKLLEHMDHAGIRCAVVHALAWKPGLSQNEISRINDYVVTETAKSARLAAFCTVDPFAGDRALKTLEKYIGEKGCVGLKLHGSMQEFYPDDRRLYPIYAWMEERSLPVLFHTGGIGLKAYKDKYCSLEHFDEVACDFPDLPMILGHGGRNDYAGLSVLLRKHKNCYADISTNFSKKEAYARRPLQKMVCEVRDWTGYTDQLLFGSDFPFYSQEKTMQYVKTADRQAALYWELERNTDKFCKKYNLFKSQEV